MLQEPLQIGFLLGREEIVRGHVGRCDDRSEFFEPAEVLLSLGDQFGDLPELCLLGAQFGEVKAEGRKLGACPFDLSGARAKPVQLPAGAPQLLEKFLVHGGAFGAGAWRPSRVPRPVGVAESALSIKKD